MDVMYAQIMYSTHHGAFRSGICSEKVNWVILLFEHIKVQHWLVVQQYFFNQKIVQFRKLSALMYRQPWTLCGCVLCVKLNVYF